MAPGRPSEFVVECFWPGVHDADLRALDQRAEASAARLAEAGLAVRYLGSMLMREDEVVLCLFEGDAGAVRRAAEQAQIEFERILEAARSPWALATDA
ncbi:MAG TPA: nickel-binding protein [Thermoleophilaceae bacterium]|nr:nickel-binding protein [Thermoleophilaceae bacterium]